MFLNNSHYILLKQLLVICNYWQLTYKRAKLFKCFVVKIPYLLLLKTIVRIQDFKPFPIEFDQHFFGHSNEKRASWSWNIKQIFSRGSHLGNPLCSKSKTSLAPVNKFQLKIFATCFFVGQTKQTENQGSEIEFDPHLITLKHN